MKFTKIPSDTFQTLAINAGLLAHDFNPANGTLPASITDSSGVYRRNLLGATSGGITFTGTPTFSDFGEDIDNCPKNTKELKRLTAWDVKISGTFVTVDDESAQQMIGAADVEVLTAVEAEEPWLTGGEYYTRTGSGTTASPYKYTLWDGTGSPAHLYEATSYKITPRHSPASGDFTDVWVVGDYSDHNTGSTAGFVAIKVKDALSTGGFSMVTADQEKGKFAFEFTGHYSINSQDVVPFEVYVHAGS